MVAQLSSVTESKETDDDATRWQVPVEGAYVAITMPDDGFSSGWVLLQGLLIRRGGDCDARLYYDLGDGFIENQFFEIPTTSKGVINQLIYLPAGIKQIKFTPMRSTTGEFQLSGLFLSQISTLERKRRMVLRILSMMYIRSAKKKKLLKLNFFRMLVNLEASYKTASQLLARAPAPQYPQWIKQFDTLSSHDYIQIAKHSSHFVNPPYFHILIVSNSTQSNTLQQTMNALNAQLYQHFSCVLVNSDLNTKIPTELQSITQVERAHQAEWLAQFNTTVADKEWLLIVRAGDLFAPHALYRFAYEALAKPEAAVLYSDDDSLNEKGERCKPRFKPDWSLTHFRSTNFIGDAVAVRGSELAKAGGLQADCFQQGNYDLLLRVVDALGTEASDRIAHIPSVLLHRSSEIQAEDSNQCMTALRAHLLRNGIIGEVTQTQSGCWRTRYQLPDILPLVSIIVPTRDALELIQQCVDSLLNRTSYPRFEILIVDNQSETPEALAYLEQMTQHEKVRVLRYDHPFNYSAMNNMAAQAARGEVLCLLNNDTEVISPDWLEEMLGHLLQAKVGIVGAKLYFPTERIQHAGDLVGVGGVANHAHSFLPRDTLGYCHRAVVAQEFSAVTAACLVTWKTLYQQLGGLDETHLTVAFNDIDYCLRVRETGYRVVWTPYAELYHHESVSRGQDLSPEKKRRAKREALTMRKRWKSAFQGDPFYNPNLSYERADFSLSNAPIVEKPWTL